MYELSSNILNKKGYKCLYCKCPININEDYIKFYESLKKNYLFTNQFDNYDPYADNNLNDEISYSDSEESDY